VSSDAEMRFFKKKIASDARKLRKKRLEVTQRCERDSTARARESAREREFRAREIKREKLK
jgi:hypothetical protein